MDFKFVIEKKTNRKSDGTIALTYYLRAYNDTTYKYGKIINIFYDLEKAKIFLDKIKDIYPEPETKVETIYTDGNNVITIESENEINKFSLKAQRAYAIFNNYNCINVIYDDYELALKEANQYVENIKDSTISLTQEPEIIFELTINK